MIPLRKRLQRIQAEHNTPWEVLERDYLFSWVLAALATHPKLRSHMVFKGGACLKKCYFGKYRFSEDLDFTAISGAPQDDALKVAIEQVCLQAEKLLHPIGEVKLECSRYIERQAHPHGQEAFVIRGKLPWHSAPHTKIKIEVTQQEAILCPPEQRTLLHEYGEEFQESLSTYSLKEIVAEKLRAILQQLAKGEPRGWVRARPRDYYDLWRILRAYPEVLATPGFSDFLAAKCAPKGVNFTGPDSFFVEVMTQAVGRNWSSWMGPLVTEDLPGWERVRSELHPLINRLLS